jgi:alanine dehydrogenase
MALYLTDEEIRRLLPVSECVDVLDDLFRQESQGFVENLPRQRIRLPHTNMTLMGGSVLASEAYGVRHSSLTLLYNTETGKLDAVLPPGSIAWIRTGAASGVATKYMARPDASVVGIIGTGRQAVTQLEAVCAVRPIRLIKAFSRREENRNRFAAEMRERLGVDVVGVASLEECVRGAQIVITITNTRDPVLEGSLLEPGTHVNAAGANSAPRRELDEAAVERSDLIAVDNLEQAKMECGDLIWPAERGQFSWRKVVELHEVVGGKVPGRRAETDITLFESQGIGIEDVAASAYVLRKAREQGLGQELPF